tara:strand:+ start:126 stop:545 length:420 start_codon:yes stop_codon:yes gene_type:complete
MEKIRMKKKSTLIPASRKTAKATAVISRGTGKVFINKTPIEIITPLMARERMLTPLELIGDQRDKVDINIRVSGGGYMGQAEACAIAISRALISHLKTKDIKTRISEFDKHLLSGDSRRSESKKFGGPGARRRKQKSYR